VNILMNCIQINNNQGKKRRKSFLKGMPVCQVIISILKNHKALLNNYSQHNSYLKKIFGEGRRGDGETVNFSYLFSYCKLFVEIFVILLLINYQFRHKINYISE